MNDMAYIARRPCGCIFAAAMDRPERKRDVAKFTADLIRRGHAVERVTAEVVRTSPWQCPDCTKAGA